ncbi:hypothetical protein QBC34DRAFT_435989 [Podospora aff. communis PSN243]|uniref:Transmembrane protein n=1 Tax=Podospora aff. communis PSN243 TaxID=3040156 RepID=A0AAV9GVA7_9PEZI|nr:hypothetical protein QBC34DRAFT_435989 [Podospora aff. communis PSN243]
MVDVESINAADPPSGVSPTPLGDGAAQPTVHVGEEYPTRTSATVSFLRPAPTFHESEEKTIRHISASVEVQGFSASTGWETTVSGKRCERCPKFISTTFSQSVSAGAVQISAGGSPGPPTSFSAQNNVERTFSSPVPSDAAAYLVLGIFSEVDRQPRERVVVIRPKDAKWLFLKVRLATLRLRGASYFFSLKSVKAFRLYRCITSTGSHQQLQMDDAALADLRQFKAAYKKNPWPPAAVSEKWTQWVFDCLDNRSLNVLDEGAYSLEVVLGWSPSRIAIAVLSPVLLSFAVGLWFNSRDWNDLATIQTAWGVASYIATAGGLVAAVLGIISGLADN